MRYADDGNGAIPGQKPNVRSWPNHAGRVRGSDFRIAAGRGKKDQLALKLLVLGGKVRPQADGHLSETGPLTARPRPLSAPPELGGSLIEARHLVASQGDRKRRTKAILRVYFGSPAARQALA